MNFGDVAKKYEEKIKKLMLHLPELSDENLDIKETEKKIEDDLIDFEKVIDEECMNRVIATHRINMALISKLRDLKYDFNQDKTGPSYESVINTTINSLKNININS